MSDEDASGLIQQANAFAGVLVNRRRQVLLVEPADPHSPYAWTFPKGRAWKGETPRAATLRQVRKRCGYRAEVLAAIPGVFEGSASTTAYSILGPLGRQGEWGARTARTRWAEPDEAARLIGETTFDLGRRRDLAVLGEAREFLDRAVWSRRPATCREDWQVTPLSEQRTALAIDRRYDAATARRIRKGWFPSAMEEKWFAWWEEPVLHLHRSWTGLCVYEVTFEVESDKLRATSVLKAGDWTHPLASGDEDEAEQILHLIDILFVESPDEPNMDHFAAALVQAAQPNYLGSPQVVSGLLRQVIDAAIGYVKGQVDFNGCWGVMWDLAQEIATGSDYVRMPGWHSYTALGKRLETTLGVLESPLKDDDLGHAISEAFLMIFLKVRDLLLDFQADPAAEWERDALPQVNAFHVWATAVFLGTDEVTHPGRCLADFVWVPVQAPGLPR